LASGGPLGAIWILKFFGWAVPLAGAGGRTDLPSDVVVKRTVVAGPTSEGFYNFFWDKDREFKI
jgi:hypothetical protein